MFCAAEVRQQVVERFGKLGLPIDCALELEYAVQVWSTSNYVPYKVICNRLLRKLACAPSFASELIASGPGCCASVLDDQENCSSGAEAQSEEARQEAVLKSIAARNDINLPEAGTKCSRCHSTDIHFNFKQTRSADEPTTVFCSCAQCGKRWRC